MHLASDWLLQVERDQLRSRVSTKVAHKHALYETRRHPYTQALLSAIPVPDPRLERAKTLQLLQGDLPSPIKSKAYVFGIEAIEPVSPVN